jgi:hypothetical protein
VGGEAGTGERIFWSEAAVGFVSLSAALVVAWFFLVGVGVGASGALLRERAREEAVGAYSLLDGVLGRVEVIGVLARIGVFARAGVTGEVLDAIFLAAGVDEGEEGPAF